MRSTSTAAAAAGRADPQLTDRAAVGNVLVVGSINIDLVVAVERLPSRGETVVGGSFARYPGGKGANQAVAAARMGASVTFVGAVGNDDLGRMAIADLESEAVDPAHVLVLDGVSTGVALIVVDSSGENQIAVASGANASVDAARVEAALGSMGALRGGVYLANLEVADEAVLAGARFAADRGMTVLINPAPARELSAELLALHPILLPNEHEAEALTGEHDPAQAGRLLASRTRREVIVTVGAQGAIVVSADGTEWITPTYVEAVDTTGAGDAFAGALAAELAGGSTLIESARVAVRAGSMSVTARGARTAMPRRAMLG